MYLHLCYGVLRTASSTFWYLSSLRVPWRGTPQSSLVTQTTEKGWCPLCVEQVAESRKGELASSYLNFGCYWKGQAPPPPSLSLLWSLIPSSPFGGHWGLKPNLLWVWGFLLGSFSLPQLHEHWCWRQRSDSKTQERQDLSCLAFSNESVV